MGEGAGGAGRGGGHLQSPAPEEEAAVALLAAKEGRQVVDRLTPAAAA